MRKATLVLLALICASTCLALTRPKYYFLDSLPTIDIRSYGVVPGVTTNKLRVYDGSTWQDCW
jgi:hypothetical protein